MKYLTTFFALALILLGCSRDDDDDIKTDEQSRRTVIVYINGENNLSRYVSLSVSSIVSACKDIPEGCNMLVFVDQRSTTETPYIMRVNSEGSQVVKQYDEDFIATDPAKMRDVISWIETNYPADNYGLILWGHSTGWNIRSDTTSTVVAARRCAYGWDSGDNLASSKSGKWINYDTMARMLSGFPKFQYILFDCCNGQCVEVAYEFRDVASWLVGSAAEIPGQGCPYKKVMKHLFADADYAAIADSISSNYVDDGDTLPMSVVRTDRLVQLAAATRQALQSVNSYPIELSVDSLPYYCVDSLKRRIQYDMNAIVRRNCDANVYAQWKQSFDEAVPYRKGTGRWPTAYAIVFKSFADFKSDYGGVSMYVPSSYYETSIDNLQYNQLIKRYDWYDAVGWSAFGW